MAPENQVVRVAIVLDVDESPMVVTVWAHLRAQALIDELFQHGVLATPVRIDVESPT